MKSDVWAYGVLIWEVATYGSNPYPGVDLHCVLERLETGYRMKKPKDCPDALYAAMAMCWEWNPDHRPMFKDIAVELESAPTVRSAEPPPLPLSRAPQIGGAPPTVPARGLTAPAPPPPVDGQNLIGNVIMLAKSLLRKHSQMRGFQGSNTQAGQILNDFSSAGFALYDAAMKVGEGKFRSGILQTLQTKCGEALQTSTQAGQVTPAGAVHYADPIASITHEIFATMKALST